MAVNMPSPSTGPPPPVMLEVHVLPGGYTLNQDQMDLKMLEAQLLRHTQFDKTQTVTIKVSMRAKQKNLIYVLDRCEKLDLVNLNVLTLR
jgi:biopolymer transport protein ExbD